MSYDQPLIPHWPLRLPEGWDDVRILDWIRDTPFDALLLTGSPGIESAARAAGLTVGVPDDVAVVKGVWPGIRRGRDVAEAGPTGAPWIDSNGWAIRLARMRNTGKRIWVESEPAKETDVIPAQAYLVGLADAAVHGGRWVLPIDRKLLLQLMQGKAFSAAEDWKDLIAAMRFFSAHKEWSAFPPHALVAIVSDFSGPNEFLSQELLNLTARRHQPYKILEKKTLNPGSLAGLREVVLVDAEPPTENLRKTLLAFVERGGLLVAGPKWGAGGTASRETHPRFELRLLGKGRIAIAKTEPDDPFLLAGDAQVLLSHRYDLVRMFNSGSIGSHFTMAPDGRGLVHLVNYTGRPSHDLISVRVAGNWRAARLWSPDRPDSRALQCELGRGYIEVHPPPIAAYGAIELMPA